MSTVETTAGDKSTRLPGTAGDSVRKLTVRWRRGVILNDAIASAVDASQSVYPTTAIVSAHVSVIPARLLVTDNRSVEAYRDCLSHECANKGPIAEVRPSVDVSYVSHTGQTPEALPRGCRKGRTQIASEIAVASVPSLPSRQRVRRLLGTDTRL